MEGNSLQLVTEIDSDKFPDIRKYKDQDSHKILYRLSPDDYRQIEEIWNGSRSSTAPSARSGTAYLRA